MTRILQFGKRGLMVRVLTLATLMCAPALADIFPYLDFKVSPQSSGSISYDGSRGPLVGTKIVVGSYLAVDTPVNPGTFDCPECLLNFSTGNLTDDSHGAWIFGPGGSLRLTQGTVSPVELVSGTFSAAAVQPLSGGMFQIAIGGFNGAVDSSLAAHFGSPEYDDYWGVTSLQFITILGPRPPSGFSSNLILGGDLAVTPAPCTHPVPEPTDALWQLGLSSAAILLFTRKLAARRI